MGLNFDILRMANELRLPQFKDRQGNTAHDHPDGSDWSLAEWFTAAQGEMGELASELKKARRGDYGKETRAALRDGRYQDIDPVVVEKILKEVADTVIYLDIFCQQLGAYMGDVVLNKFNEVSERVDATVRIHEDGHCLVRR